MIPLSCTDTDLLHEFECGLDPRCPEKSALPARILGYGEISTIFEIIHDSQAGLAFKRMPIFTSLEEMDRYERLFHEYNRLLSRDIGIAVPAHASARVIPESGNLVIYNIQEKLPCGSFCHDLIRRLDDASSAGLFRIILRAMKRVWDYNSRETGIRIGLDGQLSNWALKDCGDSGTRLPETDQGLLYIDTSTPLMRKDGQEQLQIDLFLRSVPSFLVWIIKSFFLQGILDRYYDFRLVAVDLIANLYKEQRPGLIPLFVRTANDFFETEAPQFFTSPLTEKEVRDYYRLDAFFFSLFLSLRKLDRLICTRLRNKPYPYILPGKIKR